MPLDKLQRDAVVEEAETWCGTLYRGWSCVKGAGTDCGQLIYGVFHNCGFLPVIDLPKDYPLYIGQHRESTAYVDLVLQYFREIPEADVQPGDIVVWKLIGSKAYCHAAIIKSWPSYCIHAYSKAVTAVDAGARLLFKKSEKIFFTLKDEFIKA